MSLHPGEAPGYAVPDQRKAISAEVHTARRRLHYSRVRPSELGEREWAKLVRRIADVMREATSATEMPGQADPWIDSYLQTGSEIRLKDCCLLLVEDDRLLVGLVAYRPLRFEDRVGLHLFSAYFRPEFQGVGLGYAACARIVLPFLLAHPLSKYLFLSEVHNPIVVAGCRKRLPMQEVMYPGLGNADPNPILARVAAHYAERAGYRDFDPTTGVVHGLTPARPPGIVECRDPVVRGYFADHVDPARGDSLLVAFDGSRQAFWMTLGEVVRAVPRATKRYFERRQRALGTAGP